MDHLPRRLSQHVLTLALFNMLFHTMKCFGFMQVLGPWNMEGKLVLRCPRRACNRPAMGPVSTTFQDFPG